MMIPLTYRVPVIMQAIEEVQRHTSVRLLGESDVKVFLNACLIYGWLLYQYPELIDFNSGHILMTGGSVSNSYNYQAQSTVISLGWIVLDKSSVLNIFRTYASKNKRRGAYLNGILYSETLAEKIYGHSRKTIDLNDCSIPNKVLTYAEEYPLYINTPLLNVYVKEKMSGNL